MNFRQCVIDCIAEGEVVQSFNRLHARPVTQQLLSLLRASGEDQSSLVELAESDQELLACFILFVHRHVWRKMKFAQARVTRVREVNTGGVDVGVAQFVQAVAIGSRDDYVECDG